jgi:hypothetical protein
MIDVDETGLKAQPVNMMKKKKKKSAQLTILWSLVTTTNYII